MNVFIEMTRFTFVYVLISFIKFCSSSKECRDGFDTASFEIKPERPKISFSSSNTIFLVTSTYTEPETFDNFEEISKLLGFRVIRLPKFCPDAFEATQIASEQIRNVVSLNVSIPAHILDNTTEINQNLTIENIWGEDTEECNNYDIKNSPNNCKNVCKFDSKQYSSVENVKTYNKCEMAYQRDNVFSTVMSKSLAKYKLFMNFFRHFDKSYRIEEYAYMEKFKRASRTLEPKGPIVNQTILVCADEKNIWHKEHFANDVRFAVNCTTIESFPQHTLLAALAPKPYYDEDKTYVPTIFYNIPYLLPEHKDAYPHGIPVFDNYNNKMKRGLMVFLETMGWSRIAVVSDDSKYSEDFEAELVNMFKEKNIIHVVEQCQGKVCEFDKALKTLKEKNARVIIGNVGQKYAKDLVVAAAKHGLTSYDDIMWIWRDWPFKYYSDTQVLGEVFSLFLSRHKYEDHHQNTDLRNILDGINFIKEIVRVKTNWESNNTDEITNHELEKSLYREIQQKISSSDAWVHLKSIKADDSYLVFSVKLGDEHNTKEVNRHDIHYKDLQSDCSHRSYNYNNPCLDAYPLLIMGVICFVLLVVLGTVYFMHTHVNKQIRYRTFNE